jgi:cyanophycin synthetase
MKFTHIKTLRGPNVWSRRPVLEVELDAGVSPPGFSIPHWQEPIAEGTPLAEVVRGLALYLQQHTRPASPGEAPPLCPGLPTGTDGSRFAVEYEEEAVGLACLEAARQWLVAGLEGREFDLAGMLTKLRDLAHEVSLGPSTRAIVEAARARGIPVHRLSEGSLVQLGWGERQRRICTAETDGTSAIAEAVAQNKNLTRALLRTAGVPVPYGYAVASAEEAWEAVEDIGVPVVVKPQFGNHGRAVAVNLTTREQVQAAYAQARAEDEHVIVEQFIPGSDYRLLVVGNQLVAAALREPAHVIGDGVSTVRQLVEEVNKDPRRSDGHATVLSIIKIDEVALEVLQEQGFTPESVPPQGARVLVRRNANLSTGGTASDVTEWVHPDLAAAAVAAAGAVGLDIAGVDVVSLDIRRPLAEVGGVIVEVNAGPGLRMHLEPSRGKGRPVGEHIVSMLFPPAATGRIPVVAVMDGHGGDTTADLIAKMLRQAGRIVGTASAGGTSINGRHFRSGGTGQAVRHVLMHPQVQAGVFAVSREAVLQEGLTFDACDVAVFLGAEEGAEGARRVLAGAVAPTGALVLNVSDMHVSTITSHCPGEVVLFSRDVGPPLLHEHRSAGGRAVFLKGRDLILARGEEEAALLTLDAADSVEGLLAAVGAAWALGISPDVIRDAVRTRGASEAHQPEA